MAAVRNKQDCTGPRINAALIAASLAGSAAVMAFALASPSRSWLGWVTLLPVFYAIRVLSPARALAAGGFWGACLFAFAARLNAEFDPSWSSAALLTAVPALYAAGGAFLTRRAGFSPYLLALGWMGVELALSPVGLHQGLLAGTQGDSPILHLVGSFTGYAVLGFVVAYVNALLFTVLAQVPLCGRGLRVVLPSSEERRLVPTEVLTLLSSLIRPSRPRAPPALCS